MTMRIPLTMHVWWRGGVIHGVRSQRTSRSAAQLLTPRTSLSTLQSRGEREDVPRVIGQDVVYENAWLRLKTIRFLDQRGAERKWTGLERTTTYPQLSASGVDQAHAEKCDAVVVFPFLTRPDAPMEVILIRQFRPPVGRWVIELPAGLIDGDEEPETAAARELEEETGYKASRVLHVGPPMVNDQGITNGTCRLLLVEVRQKDQEEVQTQRLEEDEMIHVLRAPFDGLIPWLLERRRSHEDAIDARLYSYALGLQAIPSVLKDSLKQ